jgi:hypothetical protein
VSAFPGAERLVHDWLVADVGVRVCSELPADLADVLPIIQAVRIGGPHHDEDPYLQIPTMSVDVFADGRQAAYDLAQTVDLSIRRHLPGAKVLGASVGMVRTLTGPAWRAWDDTTRVRRVGMTYQLWLKAPSS